jgi:GNAT superfamily N-acetyltransferase
MSLSPLDDPATEIRPYEPRDRAAVRVVCRATAYGGEGTGLIDPELFVDLMTRYFTDFAHGSLWVAEREGRVAGYLAGCLDRHEFHRLQIRRVVPAAVGRALGRGLLLRRELWSLLLGLPGFLVEGGRRGLGEEDYPGHLHVNLVREARGRALGSRLVERFLDEARGRRLRGVRATVYEDNRQARRFFERLGFHPLGRKPAFKPPLRGEGREWKIVYGRRL